MRLYLLIAFAVLVVLALAQPGYKLEGHYVRSECECTSSAVSGGTCDDIWITDYPLVQVSGAGPTWSGVATSKNLVFKAAGAEVVLTQVGGTGYYCHGFMGKQIICEDPARTTLYCTVTFSCVSGDCVTSITAQSMRSVMYPILGFIFALAWLLIAFLKGLPVELLILIGAIVLNVLGFFLLVNTPFFPALVAMGSGSLSLLASKGKNSWALKLAVVSGIFTFLMFAGLNPIGEVSNTNYFDVGINNFLTENCFRFFGTAITDQRCAQYVLFTGFCGYLITLISPLLVMLLLTSFSVADKS